jgi:hypothetical protein
VPSLRWAREGVDDWDKSPSFTVDAIRRRSTSSLCAFCVRLVGLWRRMNAHHLGEVLWNYLRMGAHLDKREAIVVFGGHDLRVAEWAGQLLLESWASIVRPF